MPTGSRAVEVKVTDRGWDKINKVMDDMKECYTSVGLHEGSGEYPGGIGVPEVGAIQEFGATIDNGWGKGIHIVIPERSFERAWVDEKKGDINNYIRKLVGMIIDGAVTGEQALGLLGEFAVTGMKQRMKEGIEPPLSPNTLRMRKHGGSTPLIDTAQLWGAIQHTEFMHGKPAED
jgi:hypothetical protein